MKGMRIWGTLSMTGMILSACTGGNMQSVKLGTGPHLFIDDYLIGDQTFLTRTVHNPEKLAEPVITGEGGDDNFQPYFTVIRDPESGMYRMWYNTFEHKSQSHIGYIESKDGINWIRPHRVLEDPHFIKFGVSVIDRGPGYSDPEHRYILGAYEHDGTVISTSPDGLNWTRFSEGAALKHNHDITSIHWDPLRRQFLMIVSVWERYEPWNDNKRTPHQSVSTDLVEWAPLWPIINAKEGVPIEEGETQFYAMGGVITRGDLLIGLVKVLRDDLNATYGKTGKEMGDMDRKAAGIGYTVLAWSRDGKTWQRDYQPFIPRNPVPGTFDHAMAWGDEQIIVDGQTYIYYAGYARGHKVNRFKERVIGMAIMPRDRYVSRDADLFAGSLITKPVILDAGALTVNAHITGELRVRLTDPDGNAIAGFDWVGLQGDAVDIPVEFEKSLKTLAGKPVRIEFELQKAQLFGFDLMAE
jgi:hypothetical protein